MGFWKKEEAEAPMWFCGTAQEWNGTGLKKAVEKPVTLAGSMGRFALGGACIGAAVPYLAAAAGGAASLGPLGSACAIGAVSGSIGMIGISLFEWLRDRKVAKALLRLAKDGGGEERLLALEKSVGLAQRHWDTDDKASRSAMSALASGLSMALKKLPDSERPNLMREKHSKAMEAMEKMREGCPEAFAMKDQKELLESVGSATAAQASSRPPRKGI